MTLLPLRLWPPPQLLKARIVEAEETAVASQGIGKHIPPATNTHATLEMVFCMRSDRFTPGERAPGIC
jgi:hypothetical protein